jgi:methylmalonyl-CoA/ethylmalonyl-CoA epimerase
MDSLSKLVDLALRLHHVGVACEDIEEEALRLAPLGYKVEGAPFIDPRQGVRGLFVGGQTPRLELLQPLASDGVLTPWLKRGVKLYHLAYETDDLEQAIARLREGRAKLVVPPVESVAFGGRRIAFVMLPTCLLVELIAKG